MQVKYQRKPLKNTEKGVPDPARLLGLARRYLQRAGVTNPSSQAIEAEAATFAGHYKRHVTQIGTCAGMVCNWAINYLGSGDPESVDLVEAQLLQGEMLMTGFKRLIMDKDNATSAAADKLYAKRGASLKAMVSNQMFPINKREYSTATAYMIDWITIADYVPFLLTISLVGGNHAIGLLCHDGSYYICEPNEGIYKFENKDVALREINNHLIASNIRANSAWNLNAIVSSA